VSERGRGLAVIFGLVAMYFAGMTALALTVDSRFFFNDAVSLGVWVAIAVAALGGALASRPH
jgi:NO-binding membrane sensor protein with MHYT domain